MVVVSRIIVRLRLHESATYRSLYVVVCVASSFLQCLQSIAFASLDHTHTVKCWILYIILYLALSCRSTVFKQYKLKCKIKHEVESVVSLFNVCTDRFQAVELRDTKRITISAQSTSTLGLVTVSGLLCLTLTGVLSTAFARGNKTKETYCNTLLFSEWEY